MSTETRPTVDELRRRIAAADALITPDGRCWVIDRDGDEWPHRASACLLCHVRAVLRGEEAP